MTGALDDAWRRGTRPFAGAMLRGEDLSVGQLRAVLLAAVEVLATDAPAQIFDDWHEHDGFGVDAEPIGWGLVRAMLISDASLAAACPTDFAVYRALSGDGWLLRFAVDDGEGRVDLSADDAVLDAVTARVAGVALERRVAREYFRAAYAG